MTAEPATERHLADPIISVDEVSFRYGERPVLETDGGDEQH